MACSKFDAFIHMDAKELSYVYNWRSEQEHHLISKKGTGMTDQQVKKFIDGCKYNQHNISYQYE